jgi:hypothetical protein
MSSTADESSVSPRDLYTHGVDGRVCVLMEDGTWVQPVAAGEAYDCDRSHGPETRAADSPIITSPVLYPDLVSTYIHGRRDMLEEVLKYLASQEPTCPYAHVGCGHFACEMMERLAKVVAP